MAAHSTYQTYLMHFNATGTKWEKLHDISSLPDLMQEPETIETTTLTDAQQTYIKGIKGADNLVFESYYDLTVYKALAALDDDTVHHFAIYFGASSAGAPDGNRGMFFFDGYLTPVVKGGGVNEAVKMDIVITPTTVVELKETAPTSFT